jgi:hypothetical protein
MPSEIGYLQTYAAAGVLRSLGPEPRAVRIVASFEARLSPELLDRIERTNHLYRFLAPARR